MPRHLLLNRTAQTAERNLHLVCGLMVLCFLLNEIESLCDVLNITAQTAERNLRLTCALYASILLLTPKMDENDSENNIEHFL